MRFNQLRFGVFAFAGGAVAITAVVLSGCSTGSNAPIAGATNSPAAVLADVPGKGRAQIWSENCARCHNMRPPDWYSSTQWAVAVQQMRVRGYLTGQEQRAVLELLQASH